LDDCHHKYSRKRASYAEILVLLRLRWQIERLFRLWKEYAKIDEWRTAQLLLDGLDWQLELLFT